MGNRRQSSSNYESGADVTMEFAGLRFRFNAGDFAQRVEDAAVRLSFVPRFALDEAELRDLVALATDGEIAQAESPLAAHVGEHREALLGFDEDVVYWLRKLVFRGAWLDQQIKDGLMEPVFDDHDGFRYRSATTHDEVDDQTRTPDWSAVGYRMGTG